jgi:hypothetical protein
MKIEEGRYYRDGSGQKIGPMLAVSDHLHHFGVLYGASPDGREYSFFVADGRRQYGCAAGDDLISEWPDAPDLSNPLGQVLGLMPPETQEAMKAHGGPYEIYGDVYAGGWRAANPAWTPQRAYRVKPAPIRENVTLIGNPECGFDYSGWTANTHRIQFDLIDGKPDCASIKMEELE